MHLLAIGWNPLMAFLTVDYFSRGYFAGLLLAVTYSVWNLIVVMRSNRLSPSSLRSTHLPIAKVKRNLNFLFSLGVILASACFANQILNVSFIYMVGRFTDANPAFALQQAWDISQFLACFLLLLHTLRWYAFAALDQHLAEPSLPTAT